MTWLQLGISAKVIILVSHLCPKDIITKAYPDYSKSDKVEGLVVASKGPKLICHEEKVVLVFCHPPKDQQAEEFDCWALHQFIHITEEGDKSALFNGLAGVGEIVVEAIQAVEIITNNTLELMKTKDSDDNVPTEIAEILESCKASGALAINNKDALLICSIFPGMLEDNNQPLPKNIPIMAEQNDVNHPEVFGGWECSGSCYHCLDGGRKSKACLNLNNEVSPTIQQLFEMLFFKDVVVGMIVPVTY